MSHEGINSPYRWMTAAMIAAALFIHLLGNERISLWDCDEAWYAQASAQMVRSGDWVVPRFLDRPRFAKPIFIYWAQAASMKLLGVCAMAARLPSALGVTLTNVLLAAALGRILGARRVMYTMLVFATNMLVITCAKMCHTDGVLLLFITAAQICLYQLYRGTARPITTASVMWACVGLAGLTKGPFVLLVLAGTAAALLAMDIGARWRSWSAWRQSAAWWKRVHLLPGLLIVAAIAVPWLAMAYSRDPAFFSGILQEPVRHAAINESGGHPNYPGYYLLTIWVVFFPWSLFLPAALAHGWRHRRVTPIRFALATVLGNVVFLELILTKLPHYLLPAYSSLALLTASALLAAIRRQRRVVNKLKSAAVLGAGIWAAGAIALACFPLLAVRVFPDGPLLAGAVFAVAGIAYGIGVFLAVMRRRLMGAALLMGWGLLAVLAVLLGFYLPRAQFVHVPQRTAQRLAEIGASGPGQVAVIGIELYNPAEYPVPGYPAPSLAFYAPAVRERADDFLLTQPTAAWPKWVVATRQIYDTLPADRRGHLEQIASFRGFNYNLPLGPIEVVILKRADGKMSP